MLHCRAQTENVQLSKSLMDCTVCVLAENGETCVSVKQRAGGPEIFHFIFGHCGDGGVFSTMCCVGVYQCNGQSHAEGSSGGRMQSGL